MKDKKKSERKHRKEIRFEESRRREIETGK
jgi:hypothetical protein